MIGQLSDEEYLEKAKKRFWAKVNKVGPDECWEWTGGKRSGGYGAFIFYGRTVGSHVAAWIFTYGFVSNGLCVLHECDNPPCCNPNHLFLGTHAENMLDCAKKGRRSSTLTADEVLRIRKRYANGNISQARLGMEYGTSDALISMIISRKRWRHI